MYINVLFKFFFLHIHTAIKLRQLIQPFIITFSVFRLSEKWQIETGKRSNIVMKCMQVAPVPRTPRISRGNGTNPLLLSMGIGGPPTPHIFSFVHAGFLCERLPGDASSHFRLPPSCTCPPVCVCGGGGDDARSDFPSAGGPWTGLWGRIAILT